MNDASIRFIAVGHAGAQILSGLRARSEALSNAPTRTPAQNLCESLLSTGRSL